MSAPGDSAFLRIESVTKDFGGFRAVDQVSLDVARGEIFALLGSSGSGKSTLLRMLAGFEAPTAGRVLLGGVDLAGQPPYERPVNMMFQSYALFPHLDVQDNVAFGLRREGLPKAEIAERVGSMLKLVQMDAFARRKPHQLSGGQQQRVALARSLVKRPQLLLLDEPLGALDKKLREETQIELVNIIRSIGVTCLIVTHDQEEAMMMAARIAVMSQGRLLQIGPPAEVYESPATRFVADFIGNVNLMDGTLGLSGAGEPEVRCADGTAHRLEGAAPRAAGEAVTLAVRPEKIRLDAAEPQAACNKVRGVVRAFSYFGDHTMYHLDLAGGARLKVSVENERRFGERAFAEGDAVWASWQPSAQVVLAE
jgi:putrescine transport system ATP-binding protein